MFISFIIVGISCFWEYRWTFQQMFKGNNYIYDKAILINYILMLMSCSLIFKKCYEHKHVKTEIDSNFSCSFLHFYSKENIVILVTSCIPLTVNY